MKQIDAKELREKLEYEFNACDKMPKIVGEIGSYQMGIMSAIGILDNMENVKLKAEWKEGCPTVSEGELYKSYLCSDCGNRVFVKTNYCSHCGAEMK